MIVFSNPKFNNLNKKKKILENISKVINGGKYIKGKQLEIFEANLKKKFNCKYAHGVGNATDAIFLSLKALGIGKGDEVITTSMTATGTGLSILNTGAKIKFVDISEKSYCMNLEELEKSISKKTKAIVIVHLYGQSCSMNILKKICKKKNIYLIEDCAQAAGGNFKGKRLGTFGDIGCLSFFPTKNLACIGDGGAIITNNKSLFQKVKSMSQYGWNKNRNAIYAGINSRLDELQASILNVKIKFLDKENNIRKRLATAYLKKIKNKKIILPNIVKDASHVWHLFVIRTKNRKKLINQLKKRGVMCGIHYSLPLHKQKIFNVKNFNLKITEKISQEVVSLPIYPELSVFNQNKIIKYLNNYQV